MITDHLELISQIDRQIASARQKNLKRTMLIGLDVSDLCAELTERHYKVMMGFGTEFRRCPRHMLDIIISWS